MKKRSDKLKIFGLFFSVMIVGSLLAIITDNSFKTTEFPETMPTLASIPTPEAIAISDNELAQENVESILSNEISTVEESIPIPSTEQNTDRLTVDEDTNKISLPETSVASITSPETIVTPIIPVINGETSVSNEVVVQFTSSTSKAERIAYVESIGGEIVQSVDVLDTVVIRVNSDDIPQSPDANVVIANSEPNYYVSALLNNPPSDPLYTQQWALPRMNIPIAWEALPKDLPRVIVAVIDSGICYDHPDLAGHILDNGYDFIDGDTSAQDEFNHGCGVAGIIAANADNDEGIAGIAPNAQIMPLRVLDASGLGTYSDVAQAIVYAVDHGAQVINLSLGGTNPAVILENAVNYATENNVTIVAATGNTGSTAPLYPAHYENVIAVGSIDEDGSISSFSNLGADRWAPGRHILTTGVDGDYVFQNGTSFAAPQISGQKALELSGINIDPENVEVPPETSLDIPVKSDDTTTLEGWINVAHGDPEEGSDEAYRIYTTLVNDTGETLAILNLSLDEAHEFDRKHVQVTGSMLSPQAQGTDLTISVSGIQAIWVLMIRLMQL